MKTGKKLVKSRQAHNKNKKRVTYWQLGLHLPRKVTRYESRNKNVSLLPLYALIFSIGVGFSIRSFGEVIAKEPELLSPYVSSQIETGRTMSAQEYSCIKFNDCETEVFDDYLSIYISQSVEEFLSHHRSESMMIMHCLAHRESRHAESDGHGDGGKAGGPFQFWEGTWTRMRKQMIADGYATEIGSRYDLKESTRTTAYAISKGWAKEWGPILRGSKNINYAECQLPSWY